MITPILGLCVLNARSVCNKTHVLCNYIVDNDLDIFALTESWLSDDSTKHKKTIGDPPGGPLEWQEGVSGSSMDTQKAP